MEKTIDLLNKKLAEKDRIIAERDLTIQLLKTEVELNRGIIRQNIATYCRKEKHYRHQVDSLQTELGEYYQQMMIAKDANVEAERTKRNAIQINEKARKDLKELAKLKSINAKMVKKNEELNNYIQSLHLTLQCNTICYVEKANQPDQGSSN